MLFKPVSALRPSRVQGAYIAESEVDHVVSACVEASAPAGAETHYVEGVTESKHEKEEPPRPRTTSCPSGELRGLHSQASVSAVQRRFRVGYSRAGRIIDASNARASSVPTKAPRAARSSPPNWT